MTMTAIAKIEEQPNTSQAPYFAQNLLKSTDLTQNLVVGKRASASVGWWMRFTESPHAVSLEEDLENCISVLNTICTMFELTPDYKLKFFAAMLHDDAQNYYSSNSSLCDSFYCAMFFTLLVAQQ